jgi:hypothetical protein
MKPSFTRGEYWLLEAVVEYRVSIAMLASEDVAVALNRSAHGLDRRELYKTFVDLVGRGLIVATEIEGPCFVPEPGEVEILLDGGREAKRRLWYGLTAEGGRQWESFALPNWDHFLSVEFSCPEQGAISEGQYVCANKERLERYFLLAKKALVAFDENSARWDVLHPWQATYWKMLPLGYRVQFRGDSELRRFPPDPRRKMMDMRLWYAWR